MTYETKVLEGLTIRETNQIEYQLETGVNSHHNKDDMAEWPNRIFK